jgi:hypothetical protein
MDYEAYTPDSTSRLKSGYAYRVLGHDAATYYQYAIYVRVPPASPIIPSRARRPSKRVTERLAGRTARPNRRGERRWCHRFVEARADARLDAQRATPARRGRLWPRWNRCRSARAARAHPAPPRDPSTRFTRRGCAIGRARGGQRREPSVGAAVNAGRDDGRPRRFDRSTGLKRYRFLDFFEVSRDTFSRATTTTRASLLTTNRNVTHRVFRASRVAGG